jgi:DNA-binding transcriptional MerR regulator
MSMRISELARDGGVSLATAKFYLREGLLPAGRATAPTQAQYGPEHVARLRLIRALVDVGGLSLAAVREVLAALDAGPDGLATAIGQAHQSLIRPAQGLLDHEPGPRRALALVDGLGWSVDPRSTALPRLEAALEALDDVGLPPPPEHLRAYAEAALEAARADIAGIPPTSPGGADAVAYVVLGTVLYEPVLLALRRLAQQHVFTSLTADARPAPGP